jgi:hypothetical protein
VLLLLALSTAFYMGLIPKLDYAYLLHVDEWIHMDSAKRVLEEQGVGSPPHYEAGYHILLVELHALTGLDWFQLFRWLPPVFFTVTVLLTYLVGQRFGCGLESAFLATMVPTTIRFLGPAFGVPVALGMLAVPLCLYLFLSPNFGLRGALLGSLVLFFVGITHPTSALLLAAILVIIAGWTVLGNRGNRQGIVLGALGLLSIALPATVMLLWRQDQVVRVLKSLLEVGSPTALSPIPDAVDKFGVLPAALGALGAFSLGLGGSWRCYAVVTAALMIGGVIFAHDRTLLGFQSLADRGWLHFMLLVALMGGYGLAKLREGFQQAGTRLNLAVLRSLGVLVAGTLLTVAVVLGVRGHKAEFYYRLVDDATIADFQWATEQLAPGKRVAVLRTDLAYAYRALTRGPVQATESFPFLNDQGRQAMKFLFEGGNRPKPENLSWRSHNIGLIYAPHWVDGAPFFDEPRQGVFIPASVQPQ